MCTNYWKADFSRYLDQCNTKIRHYKGLRSCTSIQEYDYKGGQTSGFSHNEYLLSSLSKYTNGCENLG